MSRSSGTAEAETFVVPAEAGSQRLFAKGRWIPAFAEMTMGGRCADAAPAAVVGEIALGRPEIGGRLFEAHAPVQDTARLAVLREVTRDD